MGVYGQVYGGGEFIFTVRFVIFHLKNFFTLNGQAKQAQFRV